MKERTKDWKRHERERYEVEIERNIGTERKGNERMRDVCV